MGIFIGVSSVMIGGSTPSSPANHLMGEKSPYLLQHAYNPVDWHPWGEEAFEKARKEDKPIFLSIGYSTCHWCHVMEHESFENPEIASVLNQHFISIKVDREERPDIDQIYMTATQALTGSGGWPMSVFLNHQLKPFFCGTYFPPDNRHGRPGFPHLLGQLQMAWKTNRHKIESSCDQIATSLRAAMEPKATPEALAPNLLAQAYRYFQQSFDRIHGGFGSAPKFPRTVQFPFLLRYYHSTGDGEALHMATLTLKKMAQGGIYDQLGGGFSRYSVDDEWRVPHFEKMLYDNGQLLSVYTETWQVTRDPFFQVVAGDMIRYVAQDLTHPEGAFFSAEDADSEGEEGRFYVWTRDELESILGAEAAAVVAAHFDFKPHGNFEHGKNVLHGIYSFEETAKTVGGKTPAEIEDLIKKSKALLLAARCKRIRPALDDKILTAWNGLMISGLARAGRVFGIPSYIDQAARAANFILKSLVDPSSGQLLRRWRDGEAKGNAFLDDYAFFIEGLLQLFEATQEPSWIHASIRLTRQQVDRLWDPKQGGFFFAGAEDDSLLLRPKSDYEGAEPSGNSVSVLNLLKLAQLTGSREYTEKAEATLKGLSGNLARIPASMPLMLTAYYDHLSGQRQVVLVGDPRGETFQKMWRIMNQCHLPGTLLVRLDGREKIAELSKLNPQLVSYPSKDGKATAYVCLNQTCKPPITEPADLERELQSSSRAYAPVSAS